MDFGESPIYQKLTSVKVPVLTKQAQQEQISTGRIQISNDRYDRCTAFPFVYKLELDLYPVIPLPTNFEVSSMFNDMEGKVHKAPMEHLFLDFVDLLLPPQVPDSTTLVSYTTH